MLPSSLLNTFNPASATPQQRRQLVSWSVPKWSTEVSINGFPFTAPIDCMVRIHLYAQESAASISVNGKVIIYDFHHTTNGNNYNDIEYFIPVSQGHTVNLTWGSGTHSNNQSYFPFIGVA